MRQNATSADELADSRIETAEEGFLQSFAKE
jgi:hypothetical protein